MKDNVSAKSALPYECHVFSGGRVRSKPRPLAILMFVFVVHIPSSFLKEKGRSCIPHFTCNTCTLHLLHTLKHLCMHMKWLCDVGVKGEVRRKMKIIYVLGFVVLRDVVKVFPVSSSSSARKTTGKNRARSHSGAWRGLKTKWDLKLSLPSPTYLIRYLFI